MPRTRLSREESQAETRRKLLASARETFAEKGFGGSSVEEVAERAGYSRGAVYSNFEDKDELFLALLDEHDDRQWLEVGELGRNSPTPAEFLAALRDRIRNREERREWFMLSLEFVLYAMRHPDVMPRLAARQETEITAYAYAAVTLLEALDVTPPAPPEQLGTIIRALERGLMIHEFVAADPEPGDGFIDALMLLVRAAAALSKQTGGEGAG